MLRLLSSVGRRHCAADGADWPPGRTLAGYTSEAAAGAALAQRRRRARQEAERQARLAEEERQRREDEERRQMEQQVRVMEEARRAEQARLQSAIQVSTDSMTRLTFQIGLATCPMYG